jgi:hypothetical protein
MLPAEPADAWLASASKLNVWLPGVTLVKRTSSTVWMVVLAGAGSVLAQLGGLSMVSPKLTFPAVVPFVLKSNPIAMHVYDGAPVARLTVPVA